MVATGTLQKYLSQYGEPECHTVVEHLPQVIAHKRYDHCLIIPVCDEDDTCIQRLLKTPPQCQSLLLIVIINQPDTHKESARNQALWTLLLEQHTHIAHHKNIHWLTTPHTGIDLLLVDRFRHPIPRKQCVGLARKIGGDIACQLYARQNVLSPWAHHTDADVTLPENYFSVSTEYCSTQHSALVYPYRHVHTGDEALFLATQLYEQALHYYVEGLKAAGSPYAYHTLGSCIACTHHAYAACRGFPKKSGGEDFYLLNKLAKMGRIVSLKDSILQIESRVSERVPFGTGPAVRKILDDNLTIHSYLYYHPQCFQQLGKLLDAFPSLCHNNSQQWLNALDPLLQDALRALNIYTLFTHLKTQGKNSQQSLQHCHWWLDAFKTLKLIHFLEKNFPKQPLDKSILKLDIAEKCYQRK